MNKYLIIMNGESADDTGVLLIEAENQDKAVILFLEDRNDFDLEDGYDREMAKQLLDEFPVGITSLENLKEDGDNPEFDWYYEIPEITE